jgi:acyl-CoA reductase-like NAD-dependent aldehyde dehydrogenase
MHISAYRLLIGGRLVPAAATLNMFNPTTEEILAVAPQADRAQLDQAVAAAKAAFPDHKRGEVKSPITFDANPRVVQKYRRRQKELHKVAAVCAWTGRRVRPDQG